MPTLPTLTPAGMTTASSPTGRKRDDWLLGRAFLWAEGADEAAMAGSSRPGGGADVDGAAATAGAGAAAGSGVDSSTAGAAAAAAGAAGSGFDSSTAGAGAAGSAAA